MGYWLKEDGMEPTKAIIDSILNYPRPVDISGIRGFFGLVEQVAWAFCKTEVMLPFRELLKKGSVFCWTQDLDDAFRVAREKIAELVKNGVKSFETNRVTVVNTDWSKVGMGFAVLQKHCGCIGVDLKCCKEGWKLCLLGSRFCTPAESRYAPVEGEALGVAWALEKARHYVMGCPKLHVGVDHKPLLGLYSKDKALADIDNSRLCKLVEKATRYRFDAFYVKGKENSTPDALSRFPVEEKAVSPVGAWMALIGGNFDNYSEEEYSGTADLEEELIEACSNSLGGLGVGAEDEVGNVMASKVETVSWERVAEEARKCQFYQTLAKAILSKEEDWPQEVQHYKRYKEDLQIVDGVLVFKGGRSVIPSSLQNEVLATL